MTGLTNEQKKYILENHTIKKIDEMISELGFKSNSRIYRFLKQNNLGGRKLRVLTEEEKEFIRNNYKIMSEPELARRLKLPNRQKVQEFKRSEGLVKYRVTRKAILKEGLFNVDLLKNWVA